MKRGLGEIGPSDTLENAPKCQSLPTTQKGRKGQWSEGYGVWSNQDKNAQ